MVEETRMVAAQNDVTVNFAYETKPARMFARQRWQRGELCRGEIVVKTRFKTPDGSAARNEFTGEQAQTVDRARLDAGLNEHHGSFQRRPGQPRRSGRARQEIGGEIQMWNFPAACRRRG